MNRKRWGVFGQIYIRTTVPRENWVWSSLNFLGLPPAHYVVLRWSSHSSTSSIFKQSFGPQSISTNSVLSTSILWFFDHVTTIDASPIELSNRGLNSATDISFQSWSEIPSQALLCPAIARMGYWFFLLALARPAWSEVMQQELSKRCRILVRVSNPSNDIKSQQRHQALV